MGRDYWGLFALVLFFVLIPHAPHCHFDCFSGASGDMILGALVDADCLRVAEEEVALALPDASIAVEKVRRAALPPREST
jgi:hypothetical protein